MRKLDEHLDKKKPDGIKADGQEEEWLLRRIELARKFSNEHRQNQPIKAETFIAELFPGIELSTKGMNDDVKMEYETDMKLLNLFLKKYFILKHRRGVAKSQNGAGGGMGERAEWAWTGSNIVFVAGLTTLAVGPAAAAGAALAVGLACYCAYKLVQNWDAKEQWIKRGMPSEEYTFAKMSKIWEAEDGLRRAIEDNDVSDLRAMIAQANTVRGVDRQLYEEACECEVIATAAQDKANYGLGKGGKADKKLNNSSGGQKKIRTHNKSKNRRSKRKHSKAKRDKKK